MKKKMEERTVLVPRGNGSYIIAQESVKKASGFEHCVCIRAKVQQSNPAVLEYEFLVSNDAGMLQAAVFDAQMRAERSL